MTGSTPIKVTWSKDHKDIRSGGNYKISCVDNTPHLTILKADKSDTGRYFCHASNDMGKDSCSSDITVKGIWTWGTLMPSRLSLLKHSRLLKDIVLSLKAAPLLIILTFLSWFQSAKILQCSPKSPQSTSRTWRANWWRLRAESPGRSPFQSAGSKMTWRYRVLTSMTSALRVMWQCFALKTAKWLTAEGTRARPLMKLGKPPVMSLLASQVCLI